MAETVTLEIGATTKRQQAQQGAAAAEDSDQIAPIFDRSDDVDLAYVLVRRVEPLIEEGTLGRLDPSATELDIKERWGGGKFVVEGRDSLNRIAGKGMKRTIVIAGDPKFESKVAEARWLRQQGVEPKQATPAAQQGPSFMEMFALMSQMSERARQEATEAHARQLELLRADQDRRDREAREERERIERERLAREERQRREQEQAEERRARETREAEERRAREMEDARQRDREHQKAILELLTSKKGGDEGGINLFLEGVKLAKEMLAGSKDDDDDDDDEKGSGNGIAEAVRDGIKAIPEAIRAARTPASGEQAPPAPVPEGQQPGADEVVLKGPIANEMKEFVQTLQGKGKDPEKVLAQALRQLRQPKPTPPPAPPRAPALPAPTKEEKPS